MAILRGDSGVSPIIAAGNPWAAVRPVEGQSAQGPQDHYELGGNQPDQAAPTTPRLTRSLGSPETLDIDLDILASMAETGLATAVTSIPALPAGVKIFLLGAPSSAKGELAKELATEHHLPHVHMGDLVQQEIACDSDLGKALASRKAAGEHSPADLMAQLIDKHLSRQDDKGFILDAYPADLGQADPKTLLGDKGDVKVVELTQGDNCPSCVPAVQEAERGGCYFQVDDDADKSYTGLVLGALIENFLTRERH